MTDQVFSTLPHGERTIWALRKTRYEIMRGSTCFVTVRWEVSGLERAVRVAVCEIEKIMRRHANPKSVNVLFLGISYSCEKPVQ